MLLGKRPAFTPKPKNASRNTAHLPKGPTAAEADLIEAKSRPEANEAITRKANRAARVPTSLMASIKKPE